MVTCLPPQCNQAFICDEASVNIIKSEKELMSAISLMLKGGLRSKIMPEITFDLLDYKSCHLVIIVAFLENATIEYTLESVCVCVCVRVCVCVFCTITQKEIDLGT